MIKTWVRVACALGAALAGAIVLAFAEIMLIGLLGGGVEGTGLVAIGLAPFAALLGAALAGVLVWRVTGSPRRGASG